MGKIFYIMGKSSSGKDTIYENLLGREGLSLHPLIMYTTRPIRAGETDGVQYHFVTEEQLKALEHAGKVIELRTYQTVYGPWHYFTADSRSFRMQTLIIWHSAHWNHFGRFRSIMEKKKCIRSTFR